VRGRDRESDQFGSDAPGGLLGGIELRMGGGCRVDGEAFGVADIGEVGKELEVFDELAPRIRAPANAEDDHASPVSAEVFGNEGFLSVAHAGVADPLDPRVAGQILRDSARVGAVAFHAQWQGFYALQQEPCVVG